MLSITNACEYPEAVVRWADYMFTEEGMIWGQFGAIKGDEPGEYAIELAKEGDLNILGEPAKYTRLPEEGYLDISWHRVGPDYRPADYDVWFTAKENPAEDIEKVLYESAVYDYLPCVPDLSTLMPKCEFTVDESRLIVDTITNMNLYIDQVTAEFITGIKNIEKGWAEYLDMLNKSGLQEYLAVNQTAYDRYMAK